uniref:Uncharacterized protein n=1 Tax=viral metagenome TaxID=1070528 RepID=A0A6C0C9Q9_9ZZZZ
MLHVPILFLTYLNGNTSLILNMLSMTYNKTQNISYAAQ